MLKSKFSNLVKYFDLNKESYSTAVNRITFNPHDFMNYYLSQSHRSGHTGPMDNKGIPLYVYHGIPSYFPAYICMYALGNLEIGRETGLEKHMDIFKNVVDFITNAQQNEGIWEIHLNRKKLRLAVPWVSGMAQGIGISCLTRAYKLYSDDRYLETAIAALKPFHKHINRGGVAYYEGEYIFFEEFPTDKALHVLNGFIFALWGLLDLARLNVEKDSQIFFQEGVKTLISFLPKYDLGYWSLYDLSRHCPNPASLTYHKLHISQLDVLHLITNNDLFGDYRDRWRSYLGKRINAFRTLPRKIFWNIRYGL